MALHTITFDADGIILRVKVLNSSVATGAGLTGLTSASSSMIISTIADVEATATTYTVAGGNVETITTLGTYQTPTSGKCRFKELDATNHKGLYEIHLANARFGVTNAKSLLVSLSGATNMAETDFVIDLTRLDLQTATVPADVTKWNGTTVATPATAGYPVVTLKVGTGTGEVSLTAGAVTVGTVNDKAGYSLASTGMDAVTLPANIITASSIATDAIIEIQSGLATQSSVNDIPTNAELATALGTTETAIIAAGDARWVTATGFATSAALATLQTTANTILEDTGTTLPAQIDDIPGGGGGGTTTVTPLAAGDVQRVTGTTIEAYVDEVAPITVHAVTDASGDPVDLDPLDLIVHIEDQHHNVIESIPDPTISGVDDNDFTFTPDAATVAQVRQLLWSLRINSTGYVLAHGVLDIKYAARGE